MRNRAFLILLVVALGASPAAAQAVNPGAGTVAGTVTTQGGTVLLPGVGISITDSAGRVVAETTTGESGQFSVQLSPGKYTVAASLTAFVTTLGAVTVTARTTAALALDLPLEKISQSVEVVAPSPISTTQGTIAQTDTIGGKDLDQYAPSGGLQASLRLLASIIEVPGGVSIKGGRPNQAGIQLGASTLIDPATGLAQLALPDDAIDSVAVLPNPYAVEYGRFSSGLVVIQTRRAGDQWKTRLNNIDPTFYTSRTNPIDVLGVGWWGPRLEVGGPLLKDRLYLEQTAQFRYNATDIPSLPITELKTAHSFSSFTRIDGNLSPRHSFVATGGVFPAVTDWATLGTFTPPPATVNLDSTANAAAVTERAVWTDSVFTETTVQAHDYVTDVVPQGNAAMQLLPETTNGNFFNQQHRDTGLFQVISSLSGSRSMTGGLHLYKIGIDVLHSAYNGSSLSHDVLVERSDGTLARRLDFSPLPSVQQVSSTDIALFAQDRWQPATRWYTEFGLRLDRDGVVDRFNLTPRIGAALLLDDAGASVIRGGYGLFYERTPSLAGAFNQFEPYTDTRYAVDGSTLLALPIAFMHKTADELQTPRSRTWDVSFEHRLSKTWSIHVAGIDREGRHELIVTSTLPTPTTGALLLESRGHSSYRGLEFGVHAAYGTRADLAVTYALASAHADLNSLTNYFDAVMSPIVGRNEYAPANVDVPNRLFVRGRYMPTDRWLVLGVFDWRGGMPYSNVNEYLDFVGPRNSLRFPTYARLETGLERRFKILKFQPWIGIRIRNALNGWLPTDVQSNLASPLYGTFYNSEYRQFRLQVRFER